MNEKIEQLKKEAFEFAVEKMPVGITNDPIDKVWKRIDVASNKFAELIVNDVLGCYAAIDNGNKVEGTEDFVKAVMKRYNLGKKK